MTRIITIKEVEEMKKKGISTFSKFDLITWLYHKQNHLSITYYDYIINKIIYQLPIMNFIFVFRF